MSFTCPKCGRVNEGLLHLSGQEAEPTLDWRLSFCDQCFTPVKIEMTEVHAITVDEIINMNNIVLIEVFIKTIRTAAHARFLKEVMR